MAHAVKPYYQCDSEEYFSFHLSWGMIGISLSISISYWVMVLASLQGLREIGYEFDLLRTLKWSIWLLLFLAFAYFGY
ncbi:hypothetical protein [Candidatus Williamhamiltonella defendens]|uniref:hypothetical protein n=1 Tax=Candidatus Williamhamiltonella defendens TaxID=138072 RepID=UPI00130E00AD|nr:hypothetical protein [Candidatus Hamiltonella defensa]